MDIDRKFRIQVSTYIKWETQLSQLGITTYWKAMKELPKTFIRIIKICSSKWLSKIEVSENLWIDFNPFCTMNDVHWFLFYCEEIKFRDIEWVIWYGVDLAGPKCQKVFFQMTWLSLNIFIFLCNSSSKTIKILLPKCRFKKLKFIVVMST